MFSRFRRARLPAVAAGLLAGCNAATGTDGSPPRFEVAVSGAATATLEGRAVFAVVEGAQGGTKHWVLQLQSDRADPYTLIMLELEADGAPPAGTYPAAPQPDRGRFAGRYLEQRSGTPTGQLSATAGTLTIRAASRDRVEGSVDLTARGYLVVGNTAQPAAELQVRGTFRAVRGH